MEIYIYTLNKNIDITSFDIYNSYPVYEYELCIFNKGINQIFVMYLGISNIDFIEFLTTNNYPNDLISHYINSNYNINNEIAIVYDIHSKNIIRTAFYGIL